MTIWELAFAARRYWVLAVVGTLLSIIAGVAVLEAPGVYYTQVNVVFVLPPMPHNANSLQHSTGSLIGTAGVVVSLVNGDNAAVQPVSPAASLTGEGVRHGYMVRLPNTGGQWAFSFDQPVIDVEVAGGSPDEVRAVLGTVIDRIYRTLADLQNDQQVRESAKIRTKLSPTEAPIQYLKGSRLRAVAVTVALGLAVTLTLVVLLDLRRLRRERSGERVGQPPAPTPDLAV
jgi:hypothetical protein